MTLEQAVEFALGSLGITPGDTGTEPRSLQ